jgi:hypothetical protein
MRKSFSCLFLFAFIGASAQYYGDFDERKLVDVHRTPESFSIVRYYAKKPLYSKLKYADKIGSFFQIVDQKKKMFFLNQIGERINDPRREPAMCGTTTRYTYEIIETADYYVITRDETFFDFKGQFGPEKIDSISRVGVKAVNFANGQKTIGTSGNDQYFQSTPVFPGAIVVDFEKGKGLYYEKKMSYYDDVIVHDTDFKVSLNGLWGYFGITEIKYKRMGKFEFNLAPVVNTKGKKGFIDQHGAEYF